MAACATDRCSTLCGELSNSLNQCLPAWGLTWEELGAESRVDWRLRCQNEWDEVRSGLEVRELTASQDQCLDASTELRTLTAAEDGACHELRALYLD